MPRGTNPLGTWSAHAAHTPGPRAATRHARALEFVALLGGRAEHAVIFAALQRETHAPAAICTLGLSGNVAAIDFLLPLLDAEDETTARRAAKAFGLISGFDLDDDAHHRDAPEIKEAAAALPPLEEDDLDADLAAGAESAARSTPLRPRVGDPHGRLGHDPDGRAVQRPTHADRRLFRRRRAGPDRAPERVVS